MSVWTEYYRLVQPKKQKNDYVVDDYNQMNGGVSAYNNFSWYSQVMKGAASRLQRYNQVESMDLDIDVHKALNTIAEEISSKDTHTDLPFVIDYNGEDNKDVDENTTITLRSALKHWIRLHDLNNRVFSIARQTVKYGDCFLRKFSDHKKWALIQPSDVIGIELDEQGNIASYHVRKSGSKENSNAHVEIVPAAGMVHFSLSDGLTGDGPFGITILASVMQTFRQYKMLEDSVIIYRIVRAPERRVFYVDTGNMPPHKVKAHLEAVRLDLRQRRIPNPTGGQEQIDSQYNPQCLTTDTMIPLLDGRELSLAEIITEYDAGKKNWVYSVNPETGETVPGPITWAGMTRKNAKLVRVTLDNGKTITCTPDHKFPILGEKEAIRADQLTHDMPLISWETREENIGYEQIFQHHTNTWQFTHHMVNEFMKASHENAMLHQASLMPQLRIEDCLGEVIRPHGVSVSRELLNRFVPIVKANEFDKNKSINSAKLDEKFKAEYFRLNQNDEDGIDQRVTTAIFESFNFLNWYHFAEACKMYNHRITKVEFLEERQDTGCLTVDGDHSLHGHHNFALSCNVYVNNSMVEDYIFATTANGRGSRVETLPGGEALGNITDLQYWQTKIFRGLGVPTSYMSGQDAGGAQYADGKVGLAYIEELRFANMIKRYQSKIEPTLDMEFKTFLKLTGLNIPSSLFQLKLPDPQNFALYRQAEVDSALVSTFTTLAEIPYISKQFALMTYLGWTEEQVKLNEAYLRKERNIPEGGYADNLTDTRMMYDPAINKLDGIKLPDELTDLSGLFGSAEDDKDQDDDQPQEEAEDHI